MLLLINLVFSFMFIMIIYFLTVGYLTIFESKILGLIQNSKSVSSIGFLSSYHFYLDFLKVGVKGLFFKFSNSSFYYLIFLVFMLMILQFSFLVLPMGGFSKVKTYHMFYYLIMDSFLLMLKFLFFYLFNYKVVSYSMFSLVSIYFLLESMFVVCCLFLFLIFLLFDEFLNPKVSLLIIILVLSFVLLFKMFSTPCDYLEMESELVGGSSLELNGLGFTLWSLFEYGYIFNSILFLGVIMGMFFVNSIYFIIFLMFWFLMFSGVFTSMSVYTILNIILFQGFLLMIFSIVISNLTFFTLLNFKW